jgi:hypothetical protein
MPELPALPLAPPTVRDRATRSGPRPKLHGPGAGRQATRLDPTFTRLTQAFDAQRVTAEDDAAAHEPDLVLVLEIAGELNEFVKALQRVPGLEFLAEQIEDEVDPDDDFAAVDREGKEHRYRRQVFLIASDRSAWQEMLSLWDLYKRGDQFPHGFAQFRHLFERLLELRQWEDRDRLELGGAAEAWERDLGDLGDEIVHFEAELWWRADAARRAANVEDLREDIEEAGGEIIATFEHEGIAYHGVLGTAPASLLVDAARRKEVRWLRTEGVRLFHPTGQFAAPPPEEVEEGPPVERELPAAPEGEPRLALFDGLPVEGHDLLAGRIVLDDPEDWAATVPVNTRWHGTAMASLLVHGDLSTGEAPIAEPVYLRPILRSDAPDWVTEPGEELPRDRLPVDLVHAAVARLFEAERVAPGVRIIVLAVGDKAQPFDRFVSPLARLVDWLSSRYRVVFLVSGGNHERLLELGEDFDPTWPADEVQHEFVMAMLRSAALRRPLAPAEAINAVTVGAAHSDGSGATADGTTTDPLFDPTMATVIAPVGPGLRRAVKPEVLFPGGRQLVRVEPPQDGRRLATPVLTSRPPGLRAAAPGTGGTTLSATSHSCGTSGATALAGREMVRLLREIDELRDQFGERLRDDDLDSVLAKAALAHRATWGPAAKVVNAAFDELGVAGQRDRVARLLGYGVSQPVDALRCDPHQATVFAVGWIGAGEAHAYTFPLPPSLAASTAERRVSLTLAWLTPINPRHRGYRRAALTLDPQGDALELFGKRQEATSPAARRGTLQHEVLVGKRAVPYADGSSVDLVVSCRADAGDLVDEVPYALLATVEVPEDIGIALYEEIRAALQVRIRPAAAR